MKIIDNFHFQSFYLLWSTFYWLSIHFFSIYLKFKIEKFFGATNCTIYFSECMLCGFMCETRKREREKISWLIQQLFRLKAFLVWTQLRHEWENPFSFYLFVLDFVKNFRKMANFSCLFRWDNPHFLVIEFHYFYSLFLMLILDGINGYVVND